MNAMKTKRDYCTECRRAVMFRYTGHDADSVYACCVECGAKFDLINDGEILRQFRTDPIARMAYYLRVVNRYNDARFAILRGRPVKVPPASRPVRLLRYKFALGLRLEAERGREKL